MLSRWSRLIYLCRAFLALFDCVSRAHEIKIRPSSVRPSVASIISDSFACISFKFLVLVFSLGHMPRRFWIFETKSFWFFTNIFPPSNHIWIVSNLFWNFFWVVLTKVLFWIFENVEFLFRFREYGTLWEPKLQNATPSSNHIWIFSNFFWFFLNGPYNSIVLDFWNFKFLIFNHF